MNSVFTPLRQDTEENRATDHALVMAGVLDPRSYARGYEDHHDHPVEVHSTSLYDGSEGDIVSHDALGHVTPSGLVVVNSKLGLSNEQLRALFSDPVLDGDVWRDQAFSGKRRVLREIRRQHNLRTTMGRDQIQRIQMFGDLGTGTLNGLAGTATATSGTSVTDSGAAFPTATSSAGNSGLQGHVVVVGPNASGTGSQVFGVILSNTATAITVDQWYAIPVTGAAGTTPNATGKYFVLPFAMYCNWMALSTDTTTPAAADVLRTADGLFGNGGGSSSSTEQTANGLARAFVQPTFPSASNTNLTKTFTYTGSSAVTIGKVVLANSLAAAGSLLMLDTLLSSTATVSANGDTLAINPWSISL